MSYQFPPDVEKLVRHYMASGVYTSEDELLRAALTTLGEFSMAPEALDDEYRQTVAALREGIADAEAGRMRPLRSLLEESAFT
jgi:Arc/MetJ-type ribon-helix-helix transcriptional regulator